MELCDAMKEIRGLTLWRPWSWAIAHAGKRIENRGYPPPGWRDRLGYYLAIHAGKKYDDEGAYWMQTELGLTVPPDAGCPQGIVAVARLAGYIGPAGPRCTDPWFCGPFGWQLDQVVPLEPVVPCRGAQGLWTLPADVLQSVRVRWTDWRRQQIGAA